MIQGRVVGDEHLSWIETTRGDVFLFNKNSKSYEYAVITQVNGKSALVPSGVAVGTGTAPALVTTPGVTAKSALTSLWTQMRAAAEAYKPKQQTTATTTSASTTSTMQLTAAATAPALADVPLLIVLVNYTDDQFQTPDTSWQTKVFGTSAGTVNDYYKEVSKGRFKYVPVAETQGTANDGIVHVQLNYANPLPLTNDENTWRLLRKVGTDALTIANQYVNFGQYDKNGDGQLDTKELSVAFIMAGKEFAYRDNQYPDYPADSHGVWGQAAWFNSSENQTTFDGAHISQFAATGERHGGHEAAIGVLTHELGHLTFGLPDLYDPWSNFTTWDLMAGAWGRKADDSWGGATPPHLSAFCKIMAGFITPTEVELMYAPNNTSVYAPLNANYNVVKILTNNTKDYFLVEQRRLEGYDRGVTTDPSLYGKYGVMIYRSEVNSYNIPVVHLMRANGVESNTAPFAITDMFSPENGTTRFAPNTTPSSLIGGVNVGAAVENIAFAADAMALTVKRDDPNGKYCKIFTATNSAHVSAGRAYTTVSGTITTYYAIGSNQSLGTSGSTSTTLKEAPAGYFAKGTFCSYTNQKPVVQSITTNVSGNTAEAAIEVSDTERDLVRVEYQLGSSGAWTKASGAGNPASGNFIYVTTIAGLANGTYQLNARATDAAGNVSTVVSKSFTVGTPTTSCFTATNSAHAAAGRATVKYSSLYYAVGSNDYLGTSGTTTSLQLQSANYWKKVTSCP